MARAGGEFRIGGLRIKAPAHEINALRQLGEMGIDGQRKSDVGERAQGADGHLVRMRVHLRDEKVGGILVKRECMRRAFGQRRHEIGIVAARWVGASWPACWSRLEGPSPHAPSQFTLPYSWSSEPGLLLRAHQGKDSAGNHRHVGSADELEHAQRVLHFLIAPGVAGHHGDAEDLDIRRLQQDHQRHLVRSAGTGAVLVDQDHALLALRLG